MKKGLNIIWVSIVIVLSFLAMTKISNNVKAATNVDKIITIDKNNLSSIKNISEQKYNQIVIEEKKESIVKTTNKVVSKTTGKKPVSVKYGTYGRLYVSNYNVALYDFNVHTTSNSTLQTIVNNKDSAAYYMTKGKLVIADHNYQGFNVLVNLKVGTTSYIKFKNGSTIKYKLISKAKGYNKKTDLVDTKGNSFFNMSSDIIMYTCYKDGIMVTLWTLA